jgi:proline iminopeptidase
VSKAESAYIAKYTLEDVLYPIIKPLNEGYLKVSDLHEIYFAEYGNPKGIPVVNIHGGPGAGSSANDMRFFDPKHYRIILFDQRGAKRSKPLASIKENTTADLISDLEKLRKALKIDKWLVFGGSWGSALALAYGQTHPKQCLGFVLRGIFLGNEEEYLQVWYGMQDIFPEAWEEFNNFLPANERKDLVTSYYKRITHSDAKIHMPAARAFIKYDFSCANLFIDDLKIKKMLKDDVLVLGLARIFAHYSMHKFFFKKDQLLNGTKKISHLPAIIVHGRYDVICRVKSAYKLHQAWPASELMIVADAGHSSHEPSVAKALVNATKKMKKLVG